MTNSEYYALDRWSYSSMKKILDHGIDYAAGAKNGEFGIKYSEVGILKFIYHLLSSPLLSSPLFYSTAVSNSVD